MKYLLEFSQDNEANETIFAIELDLPGDIDSLFSPPEYADTSPDINAAHAAIDSTIEKHFPGDCIGDAAYYPGTVSKYERNSVPGSYEGVLSIANVRFILAEV